MINKRSDIDDPAEVSNHIQVGRLHDGAKTPTTDE